MNNYIFYMLNSLAGRSVFTDQLIIFLASYLPYLFIVAVVLFLIFHKEKKSNKEILLVFITAALAWVIATILKNLIQIPRPFEALESVYMVFSPSGMFSFPSGHATFFGSLAASVYLRHKKIGLIFVIFGLFISVARVVAGVHFPLDILTGFILGYLIAYIVDSLLKKS